MSEVLKLMPSAASFLYIALILTALCSICFTMCGVYCSAKQNRDIRNTFIRFSLGLSVFAGLYIAIVDIYVLSSPTQSGEQHTAEGATASLLKASSMRVE